MRRKHHQGTVRSVYGPRPPRGAAGVNSLNQPRLLYYGTRSANPYG